MTTSKTILVVDDHEDDRVLLKQLFEANGFEVLLANNGDLALNILASRSVDLVLSDVLMPIMGGRELCRIIKSDDALEHTPVILYTSIYSNDEDLKDALEAGADHYIIKPLDPENLLLVLDQVISESPSKTESKPRGTIHYFSEDKEKFLSLYSTELVKRLEKEIDKLNQEVIKRKKIEADLSASNDLLLHYRQISPLAIIEWNTDFEVIDWNQSAEKIFGYSFEEIRGRNPVDFLIPGDAGLIADQIWQSLIAGSSGDAVINRNLTKAGNIILCEWYNTALKDQSDNVIGAISIVLDVTAEEEARRALSDKEKELRQILDSMLDAVITIDEDGQVLTFNNAAQRLFGYSADEIIGKRVNCLMPSSHKSRHQDYVKRYLETGESKIIGAGGGRELEGVNRDGETFPMQILVAELPENATGKRRFIGSCLDLTESKKQQEQLRRSQKMDALGNLTGGIAHDYNNMLGVILGYTQLLQLALGDKDSKLSEYVDHIQQAGERSSKLTRKLLSFTRKVSPDASLSDVNALLMDQLEMLEKTLTARIKLTLDLDETLWPVYLDSSELQDAVLNLGINSMHAIAGQGNLTIQTRNLIISEAEDNSPFLEMGEYVALSVIDTGSGMDEATREKIFDPFFTSKGERGTGLGLTQVYGFVERSGGVIKVDSKPGNGTQITLYFPRYHESEESVEQQQESVREDSLKGEETILIVDDEPAILEMTSEILGRYGYNTLSALSGELALEQLKNNRIDLMLTDVIMPDMDGYQLAAKVRSQYPEIKIQLASGFSGHDPVNDEDKSLHRNLLQIPYNSKALLKKIRGLLDSAK